VSLLLSLLLLSLLSLSSLKTFQGTQKKIQPSKLKTVEASLFVVFVIIIVVTLEPSQELPKKFQPS